MCYCVCFRIGYPATLSMQPQSGEKVYALSGINWGVFKDAEENRNRSLPRELLVPESIVSIWRGC